MVCYWRVSHGLGWPANAIFFYNRFREKPCFPCRSPMITRSCETRPMGWKGKSGLFRKLALVGIFLIKFSSLSAPTKIEELRTAGSDFVAQWLERATRIRKILGSIPGGAALCFFVWSGCQFFYLCRSWKRREFDQVYFVWCAVVEAVDANVFRNFWLPLTMGRNKMALAGHPRPCETRL